GITSSNLWSSLWLKQINGWNEELLSSQETDLMLRLIISGADFIDDKEAYTIIREREIGQISQRNPTKKWKQYLDVRLNYIDALKQQNVSQQQRLKAIFQDFLMVSVITLGKLDIELAEEYYKKVK